MALYSTGLERIGMVDVETMARRQAGRTGVARECEHGLTLNFCPTCRGEGRLFEAIDTLPEITTDFTYTVRGPDPEINQWVAQTLAGTGWITAQFQGRCLACNYAIYPGMFIRQNDRGEWVCC